jgi:hypothetical protein
MESDESSRLGVAALILLVLYAALVLPGILRNLSGRRL